MTSYRSPLTSYFSFPTRVQLGGGARLRSVLLGLCVAAFFISGCAKSTIHDPRSTINDQLSPVLPGLPIGGGLVLGGLARKSAAVPQEPSAGERQDRVLDIVQYVLLGIAAIGAIAFAAGLYMRSGTIAVWGIGAALGGVAGAYWLQYIMWIMGVLFLVLLVAAALLTWRKKTFEKAFTQAVNTVDELRKEIPENTWDARIRRRIKHELQDETTARLVRKAKAKRSDAGLATRRTT